ncbi:MAG: hypothetical protein K5784_00770 [Clostridiales bacterium]|nr:hypothetical protein [Clostridiales bacterium]
MKKTFTLLLLAALLLTQVCFGWEPVVDIVVYSGPGYDYTSELGTLTKDWNVTIGALAYDRLDCLWAHISFTGRDGRKYMAYTPVNTLNLEKQHLFSYTIESAPYVSMVALVNTYVYYGPYYPSDYARQFAKRSKILRKGTYVSVIETLQDYYLVEFEEDGFKARGYVPITTVAQSVAPDEDVYDYWETPSYYNTPTPTPTPSPTPKPTATPAPIPGYIIPFDSYDASLFTTVRASKTNKLTKKRVYESSHLTNQYYDYKPERAFDNNATTEWVEGSKSHKLGDYVGCVWSVNDSSLAAYGVAIKGGMQHSGKTSWDRNQRPKDITVSVNGREYYFTMADKMDEQVFYFGDLIGPNSAGELDLRVKITDTHFKKNEDGTNVSEYNIAITEIDLICAEYTFTSAKASQMNGMVKERVYESSHLTNQYYDYKPERAFDNKSSTEWVEGSRGYRLNDYLGCIWRVTDSRVSAYGVAIRGGMQHSGETSWKRNQRPKEITVTVNGRDYYYTMADVMDEQVFYFNGDMIGPDANGKIDLRVTINGTYFTLNDDGTRVSEYNIAIADIDLICAAR